MKYVICVILSTFFLACQPRPKDKIVQKEKSIDSLKQRIEEVTSQKLKLLLDHVTQKYNFNGNVLIASKGKVLLKKSYGVANLQTQKKLHLQTVFPIASITQAFTATALLQLAERSRLNVHDKLTKYYPNFPYPDITIAHLLRQTSGIPDYLTHFYTPQNQPLTHAYKQNVIDWILEEKPKLRFLPAKAQALSSTNYVILADIIEKTTGNTFSQYLYENIWKPLDMKYTYLKEPKKKLLFERATGYYADLKQLADESYVDFVYGDCGIYSTVEDLYKWEQALYDESILTKRAIEEFSAEGTLPMKKSTKQAKGWYIRQDTQIWKGTWLGFQSLLMRNPEQRYTIILLNNTQNIHFQIIAEAIQAILENKPYTLP